MSARTVAFLTYLAALRARPDVFAYYAAAQRGSLLDSHRFFTAVQADPDLRSLRDAWISSVRQEAA